MQQYSVRVRKISPNINYELMKFNAPLKNEFIPNLPGKIYREKEYALLKKAFSKNGEESEESNFGAGSSYSQYVRNEKRQLSAPGVMNDKDTGPWIMNLGTGKSLKSYKGNREGNVSENASYYVFMQTADGAFEAYPISAWYTFTPIPKHKTLNDDEAEEEFNRRDKVLNYFSIMVHKRLKQDEETEPDVGQTAQEGGSKPKGKRSTGSSDLQIRDEDEANGFDNEDDNDDTDHQDSRKGNNKKVQGKKGAKGRQKKVKDLDEEAEEESDDGDEEGQELDYMSSGPSSDSEDERKKKLQADAKGERADGQPINMGGGNDGLVAMEDLIDEDELLGVQDELALRDDEDEEEELSPQDISRINPNESSNPETFMGGDTNEDGDYEDVKKPKTKHKHHRSNASDGNRESSSQMDFDDWGNPMEKGDGGNEGLGLGSLTGRSSSQSNSSSSSSTSSDGSSDDSDAEIDDNAIQSSIFLQNKVTTQVPQSRIDAASQGPSKRKLGEPVESSQNKKLSLEPTKPDSSKLSTNTLPTTSDNGMVLNEENVRRYLTRRPMTTKDLLHKFKNKVDTKAQLADRMATILKKINPEKKFIKGKMYLSL